MLRGSLVQLEQQDSGSERCRAIASSARVIAGLGVDAKLTPLIRSEGQQRQGR